MRASSCETHSMLKWQQRPHRSHAGNAFKSWSTSYIDSFLSMKAFYRKHGSTVRKLRRSKVCFAALSSNNYTAASHARNSLSATGAQTAFKAKTNGFRGENKSSPSEECRMRTKVGMLDVSRQNVQLRSKKAPAAMDGEDGCRGR